MKEQKLDKDIVAILKTIGTLNKMDRSRIRSKYLMELNREQLLAITNSPFITEEFKEYAVMELRTFSMR